MTSQPEEPLIGLLADVWGALAELGASLGDAEWQEPTDLPGWTVQDQYAHMLGTESMLAGEQPPPTASSVDPGSLPHVKNPIGAANESWVEGFRSKTGPETLAAFLDITQRRLATLRAMSTEEWDKEGFTPEGPGPYRSFMEIRVFDCWFHEQDVREALDRPGGIVGPVGDLSAGRIPKSLPYIIGKRAGAPDGSTVVIVVDGVAHAVGVAGRAALLDDIPASPDVKIELDRRTFTRLAGGRWTADQARERGSVVVSGDQALANQILDHFGYTI
jgi:uncharacterized protein (TIGR03083 family)